MAQLVPKGLQLKVRVSEKERQGILPFRIGQSKEPLVARGGLVLPHEMARAMKLPEVIDRGPGSGRGYRPSKFAIPLVLVLHGGVEELRERGGDKPKELLEMKEMPDETYPFPKCKKKGG